MEIMKVFSSYDDYGYEDERLYSVLMTEDELVSLFSEDEKKMSTGAKVGLGVAGATAATGAGIYGAKKLGERLVNKAELAAKENARLVNLASSGILTKKEQQAADKLVRKINKATKLGNNLQKPANAISKLAKRVIKR